MRERELIKRPHILRSAYIFGKRSSSHSLRALAAVFGLSSFGFEEYLKEIRNNMYCYLSLTHLWNLLCVILEYPRFYQFS